MVFPQPIDPFRRRIERAESWIARAKQEQRRHDSDAAFVFYWIAFNAAYAHESLEMIGIPTRKRYAQFFGKLTSLDRKEEIVGVLLSNGSDIFEHLINNRYVYLPFWKDIANLGEGANWKQDFDKSKEDFTEALSKRDTTTVLSILFERLYDLRNQLMHGGARHGSENNRPQVVPGARVMALLVPTFVKLMKANPPPQTHWGLLDYPPIHDPDEPTFRP